MIDLVLNLINETLEDFNQELNYSEKRKQPWKVVRTDGKSCQHVWRTSVFQSATILKNTGNVAFCALYSKYSNILSSLAFFRIF